MPVACPLLVSVRLVMHMRWCTERPEAGGVALLQSEQRSRSTRRRGHDLQQAAVGNGLRCPLQLGPVSSMMGKPLST
jgi:hypothetical protein